jgi:hypothetical protein
MTNPHPDTERLRYEIEAKSQAGVRSMRHWPNGIVCSDTWNNKVCISNSQGKSIAAFRLKAWK